jgi:hypothetical protein
MQETGYKKGLQTRLAKWFQGDISEISPDEMSNLLVYFLHNNQVKEVKKGLQLISEGKIQATESLAQVAVILKYHVSGRGPEQEFQLPVFLFSTSRSGSIYIRNSLMKSYGYVELRGVLDRPSTISEIGFQDFGGGDESLNGHCGFITNCHLLPTPENIKALAVLSKRAHLIFIFRHPLASLFSFYYRIAHKPRFRDDQTIFIKTEDKKRDFLLEVLNNNYVDYLYFYERWLKIIKTNDKMFTIICYEDFEDNLDEAIETIVKNIGLDPGRIQFVEKNLATNYQRDERPDYQTAMPAAAFEQYQKPIQLFRKMRELAIRR